MLQHSFDSFSVTLASTPVLVLFVCNIFWSLMDNNSNILRVQHNLSASEHTQLLWKHNSVHTIRTISLNTSTGMYWIIGPFKNLKPDRFFIFLIWYQILPSNISFIFICTVNYSAFLNAVTALTFFYAFHGDDKLFSDSNCELSMQKACLPLPTNQ